MYVRARRQTNTDTRKIQTHRHRDGMYRHTDTETDMDTDTRHRHRTDTETRKIQTHRHRSGHEHRHTQGTDTHKIQTHRRTDTQHAETRRRGDCCHSHRYGQAQRRWREGRGEGTQPCRDKHLLTHLCTRTRTQATPPKHPCKPDELTTHTHTHTANLQARADQPSTFLARHTPHPCSTSQSGCSRSDLAGPGISQLNACACVCLRARVSAVCVIDRMHVCVEGGTVFVFVCALVCMCANTVRNSMGRRGRVRV